MVIAQHQEEFGGKFSPKYFWVNPLIRLNVWGKVLPATDITAQIRNCYVPAGSVITWSQLTDKESLHGLTYG